MSLFKKPNSDMYISPDMFLKKKHMLDPNISPMKYDHSRRAEWFDMIVEHSHEWYQGPYEFNEDEHWFHFNEPVSPMFVSEYVKEINQRPPSPVRWKY